jgi:hypothetical protein
MGEIIISKWYFENVKFKYLGNQNLIHKKIKSRVNSDNACFHSVQNLLSFHLLPKNVKIKIYKNICETMSFSLREEHLLRMFENRVLRWIFVTKRGELAGGWRKVQNESVHNLHSSPNIIRMIKLRRVKSAGHVSCMGQKYIQNFGTLTRSKGTTTEDPEQTGG